MIKYDYKIARNEEDETKVYTPALPTELADLVYIQGPNSSGKSTLLNLVALAFYGHRLGAEELNTSLHERLINLSEAAHQKLEFTIELSNKQSNVTLVAEKNADSKVPEVRKIGKDGKSKPLSFDQFKREFRLIYDIPQDPLSRLPLLLREIKIAQYEKGQQISRLKKRIGDLIAEVRESKNPDRLEQLQKSVANLKDRLVSLSDTRSNKELEYKELKDFSVVKSYYDAKNDHDDTFGKIKRLETQINKYKKTEDKQSKELLYELRKTSEAISTAEELHRNISKLLTALLPKSASKRLDLWNESNCSNEIRLGLEIKTIRDDISFFIRTLNELLNSEADKKQEAEFLKSLLAVVEDYKGQDFKIPGTDLNIKQFIDNLKERNSSFTKVRIKSDQINDCLSKLGKLHEVITAGVKHHLDYLKIAKERGETVEQLNGDLENEELNETKRKLEQLSKRLQEAKNRLIEHGYDYHNDGELISSVILSENYAQYASYTTEQLLAMVQDSNLNLELLKKDEENCKREIQVDESEIKRLERLGVHKFQNYLPQLEHLFSHVQSLERTIAVTFYKMISDMIDLKFNAVSDQEMTYADEVQKFLAAKIGNIRHIDKSFKLKRVDVIAKEIITTTNKKIKFADLGTGQSQGAYIEGLLNPNDNKKIIALFDEVAMMDSKTLGPIIDKLRKMYEANRLIAGIIVQKKDDGISVQNLVDING